MSELSSNIIEPDPLPGTDVFSGLAEVLVLHPDAATAEYTAITDLKEQSPAVRLLKCAQAVVQAWHEQTHIGADSPHIARNRIKTMRILQDKSVQGFGKRQT